MISIAAASIASRRHRLLQRSRDRQDPSPPRHHHRHRPSPLSKKVPLVKPTRTISAQESESSACSVVGEDEYAHAMAARARLHARLRASTLLTCSTRTSSSVPVLCPSTSTCKYSRSSRLEATAAPSMGAPSNVHTHLTTVALSNPQPDLFIGSKIPASTPIPKEAEELLLETDDCSICLESFSMGKILICWPCKHRFHFKCLTAWLSAHAQCPNCRAYILKVASSQVSTGFLRTLYGLPSEKNATSFKVNLRTSQSIN